MAAMTMTEPQLDALQDDECLPTPAQQALAEQRLAEMIADPDASESVESLIAFLESRYQ